MLVFVYYCWILKYFRANSFIPIFKGCQYFQYMHLLGIIYFYNFFKINDLYIYLVLTLNLLFFICSTRLCIYGIAVFSEWSCRFVLNCYRSAVVLWNLAFNVILYSILCNSFLINYSGNIFVIYILEKFNFPINNRIVSYLK